MLNIGLMLTKGDADIIQETLHKHEKYCDHILVINGSEECEDILRDSNKISFYMNDKDIPAQFWWGKNNKFITNGVYQILLEKAQEMYGYEGWFTIVNTDEIFTHDPTLHLEEISAMGRSSIIWHRVDYFPHITDKRESFTIDQLKWYGFKLLFEVGYVGKIARPNHDICHRQFINKKGIYYLILNENQVPQILLNNISFITNKCIKHYGIRSLSQIIKKLTTGCTNGILKLKSQRHIYQTIIETGELRHKKLPNYEEANIDET